MLSQAGVSIYAELCRSFHLNIPFSPETLTEIAILLKSFSFLKECFYRQRVTHSLEVHQLVTVRDISSRCSLTWGSISKTTNLFWNIGIFWVLHID